MYLVENVEVGVLQQLRKALVCFSPPLAHLANAAQNADLEQRQYKNDSIQSKIIPILKLARFFPHCIGGEKERQF